MQLSSPSAGPDWRSSCSFRALFSRSVFCWGIFFIAWLKNLFSDKPPRALAPNKIIERLFTDGSASQKVITRVTNKNPKVSVVTAMYKHKPFLKRRVDSILNQTFQDWEWIIVDDCSPDGSFEYARELTAHDPRVTLLQNDQNRHIAYTNQRGIDLAHGEFLYRTDSDDYCDYRFLERMTEVMERHPKVCMAHCRGLYLDLEDGIWGGWPKRKNYVVDGWDEFRRQIVHYNIKSPNLFFRREAVVAAGGFTTLPLLCSHDWYLSLRVCLMGDVAFVDEPLAAQRKHAGNVSGDMGRQTDARQMENESFLVIDDTIARVPPEHQAEAEEIKQKAYRNMASAMMHPVRWARENNMAQQAEEMERMIQKYVPLAELEGMVSKPTWKQHVLSLGTPLIKPMTYKKLPPVRITG